MLDEKQIECIDLLMLGSMTIIEISKHIGVNRRTISKWKNQDEEFRAELDRRRQNYESDIVKTAITLIKAHLGKSIENVIKIANDNKEASETRLKANKYIIDKVIADAKPPVEDTTEGKQQEKPKDIKTILKEIGADNVIDISKAK